MKLLGNKNWTIFTFLSVLALTTLNNFVNFGHATLSFTLIKNFKSCEYIEQKKTVETCLINLKMALFFGSQTCTLCKSSILVLKQSITYLFLN